MFKRFNPDALDQTINLDVDGGIDVRRGRDYVAAPLLVHAINTALALGRPLLVSGEPGCGKTELGFAIARKLGIPKLHFYSVKSDSEARSLFYDYDAVHRFHAAQIASGLEGQSLEGRKDLIRPQKYIRYRALGRAILDAIPRAQVEHLAPANYPWPATPQRSVVVIDEIDKSPRDFPNDLLNELDQLWFRVPELADWVDGAPETPKGAVARALRPIIVLTSNLERQLPDAFLRRCIFHNIEHPTDPEVLEHIVNRHLEREGLQVADSEVGAALHLLALARSQPLDKPPGLSEVIELVKAIGWRDSELSGQDFKAKARTCIAALCKTTRDMELMIKHLT